LDNPKKNIVKSIVQELDCGCDCYYNFKTDEIIAIPNFSQFSDEEGFKEAFSDSLEKIQKHHSDYIKIKPLDSFESFKIMERFVAQLADEKLKTELEDILKNKRPFLNFKHKIDPSELRQHWFDFKESELENIVEKQINV
jgi:hypothetical protein